MLYEKLRAHTEVRRKGTNFGLPEQELYAQNDQGVLFS